MVMPRRCARYLGGLSLCLGLVLGASSAGAADATLPAVVDRGAATPKALVETMAALVKPNAPSAPTVVWMGFQPPSNSALVKTYFQLTAQLAARASAVATLVETKVGTMQAGMIRSMQPGITGGWMLTIQNQLESITKNNQIDWTLATITETGDKAQVTMTYGGPSILLARENGKWYLGDGANHDTLSKDLDAIKDMTAKSLKILDQVEQEINSGALTKSNFMQEYPRILNTTMAAGPN
jgi:hypothetical protein